MPSKARYLILDCFVDEPACLGVPPFISPYPRYLYGALLDAGVPVDLIAYLTIDHLRARDYQLEGAFETVFVIGGAVVPGKYLGFRIGTTAEIGRILIRNGRQRFAVGGCAGLMLEREDHSNAEMLRGDIEKFAHTLVLGAPVDAERTADEIAIWARAGAAVVKFHPEYPALICEIETYRGCPRQNRCSFCSEAARGKPEFRRETDILEEIDRLIDAGISRFRIGSQPDILQYGSALDEYLHGFPRPRPERVIGLFGELKKRRDAGAITLLNVDNANPGTIARFPGESEEIIGAIAESVTPGDTLALGVESFDEEVIALNSLKVTRTEIMPVLEMINRLGGRRTDGIPQLLPGINLIHGLPGETAETFRKNFEALEEIRDRGLLVKRINIRKLNPVPGTRAAEIARDAGKKLRNRYEYFRERIRGEIDHVMLERVYPPGTILRGLRVEELQGNISYGRQLASYAITAKLPVKLELKEFVDAVVASHRERSVYALPLPVRINTLHYGALRMIPGLGGKRAEKLIMSRPFADRESLRREFPGIPGGIFNEIIL